MAAARRLPLVVLIIAAALGLASGAMAVVLVGPGEPSTRMAPGVPAAEPEAMRVLAAWDARRARAYARGDGSALAALYVPGSHTGAVDRATLRGYRERGLRVTGMRTQVLSVTVLGESRRRLSLRVTDVLVDAVASDGGRSRWALPHDLPSTRRVVLVREGGGWRVAEAYVD